MTVAEKISALDWKTHATALDADGFVVLPNLLNGRECAGLASLYDHPHTTFRSTITMARHNYGRGEYKYFAYPLPDLVEELRSALYPPLARIANEWANRWADEGRWPQRLETVLRQCHQAGQTRPTPLMLRYGVGDYNRLHQDIYGDIHFPLQVIVQLTAEGEHFHGGELVLVEQVPRMQSRPMVINLRQGGAVIIPVRDRPVEGARAWRRAQMRHGVSAVTAGVRFSLGLIFHDAA